MCLRACTKCINSYSSHACSKWYPGIWSPLIYSSIHWYFQRKAKTLIKLRGCAGWSRPAQSAQARRYIVAWRGPYITEIEGIVTMYSNKIWIVLFCAQSYFMSLSLVFRQKFDEITPKSCSTNCLSTLCRHLKKWFLTKRHRRVCDVLHSSSHCKSICIGCLCLNHNYIITWWIY